MLEPLQQQTCRAKELVTVDHICAGVFSHSWPELLELSAVTAAHATRKGARIHYSLVRAAYRSGEDERIAIVM
jgi:hypothetical protein